MEAAYGPKREPFRRPKSLGLMNTWKPKKMEQGNTKALLLIPNRMNTQKWHNYSFSIRLWLFTHTNLSH